MFWSARHLIEKKLKLRATVLELYFWTLSWSFHLPQGKDNILLSSICLLTSSAGPIIMDTQEKSLNE